MFTVSAEAAELAQEIAKSGKTLQAVMISHAHPDHFMGLDAIVDRFPSARVVSTANVVGHRMAGQKPANQTFVTAEVESPRSFCGFVHPVVPHRGVGDGP